MCLLISFSKKYDYDNKCKNDKNVNFKLNKLPAIC